MGADESREIVIWLKKPMHLEVFTGVTARPTVILEIHAIRGYRMNDDEPSLVCAIAKEGLYKGSNLVSWMGIVHKDLFSIPKGSIQAWSMKGASS